MDNYTDAFRIMDVLPIEDVKGVWSKEFDSLPLYELVSPGVLKISCGIKREHSDVLVFDITDMDKEFKSKFKGKTCEIKVSRIIGVPNKKVYSHVGKITTLIPLEGIYATLEREELRTLGYDYVQVVSTEEGLKIVPVISVDQMPDNLLLRIHPEKLSDELSTKLSHDYVELYKKANGLYDIMGTVTQRMDLK